MKCNFSQIIAFGGKLDSSVRTAASVYATINASSNRVLHEGHIMDRRTFLKSAVGAGALAAAGGVATPAISQRAAAGTLRLVPHADLTNFDPIWSPAYIARNAGLLVWDMLYGIDNTLTPRRQMVEAQEVSADGLAWTFRLRPGLKFHDGEPVRASDAVASIDRWAVRDQMGQMIKAIENELFAIDDRTFRWVLKKPYPKMPLALGKSGAPCCFVMPARIAATDPFRQIGEYVGSGPTRFVRNEWVPGAKAVFEKFAGYAPRQEPPSWFAGGKNIVADRIEWITIPDPATAAVALQNGEVDWVEVVIPDLLPVLRKNRNVVTAIRDPVGGLGSLIMNHLHPPFNDVRARRAILMALSQEDYMRAVVGDDDSLWQPMPGYFAPGTPLYTEEGGDILKGPRKVDAAKRLLAESGYAGEPIYLNGGPGPSLPQGVWGRHRGPSKAAGHEGRFYRRGLRHHRRAPQPKIAASPGRMAHVSYELFWGRPWRPDQQIPSRQRQ
jgi:peptide/nickel transport system substrate-binding protein